MSRAARPFKVRVILCGNAELIAELDAIVERLSSNGFEVETVSRMDEVLALFNTPTNYDDEGHCRLVVLAHFTSFVSCPTDAKSYQGLLRSYAELKKSLGQRHILSNLILFCYPQDGPLIGGWNYPRTALVRQLPESILECVRLVITKKSSEDP